MSGIKKLIFIAPALFFIFIFGFLLLFIMLFAPSEQNQQQDESSYTEQILFKEFYEEAQNKYNIPWYIMMAYHQTHPIYAEHKKLAYNLKSLDTPPANKYKNLIIEAGQKYKIDPALIAAIIEQESTWREDPPLPKNQSGETIPVYGLMQVRDINCGKYTISQCKQPAININLGTQVLRNCMDDFGESNMNLFLACYNWGSGNVSNFVKPYGNNLSKANKDIIAHLQHIRPDHETLKYIRDVSARYKKYKTGGGSSQELEKVKNWILSEAKKISDRRAFYKQHPDACNPGVTTTDLDKFGKDLTCALIDARGLKNKGEKQKFVNDVGKIAIAYSGKGFLWPIAGRGVITGYFGEDRGDHIHKGIDIAAKRGTPIYAIADGTVIYAGPASGYGNVIKIEHINGFVSVYGHMPSDSIKVSTGDKVTAGQKIAEVGSEGRSTGPHLHIEIIKDGKHQNPLSYLTQPPDVEIEGD